MGHDQKNAELRDKIKQLEKEAAFHRAECRDREKILFAIDTGLSLVNRDMTIAWTNQKISMKHPKQGNPVGQICHVFFESRELPCDPCPVQRCFETGEVCEDDRYNAASNRWVHIIAQPIKDSSGKVSQVLETLLDITERKKLMETIKNERALLRSLIDSIPDPVFYKDKKGHYLGCNQAFKEYVGLEEKDIIGLSVFDVLPREQAEHYRRVDRKIMTEEKPQRTEESATLPDGRQILSETLRTPFFGPDGELLGMIGIGHDITEKKAAETAVLESESRFRTLFREAPIPQWEVGLSGIRSLIEESKKTEKADFATWFKEQPEFISQCLKRIRVIDVNESTLEMNGGIDKATFFRNISTLFELLAKNATHLFYQMLLAYAEGHKTFQTDGVLPVLGGQTRHVFIKGTIIRGHDVSQERAIISLVDITDREKIKSELLKAHFELDRGIRERTKKLQDSNRRLRREIDERKQAQEALSKREAELQLKSLTLREMNTTLKVVIKSREEEKENLEEKIRLNIQQLVLPYIDKIKQTDLDDFQSAYLDILSSNIEDISNPKTLDLSQKYLDLTPTEINVANLVRQAKTSKEIGTLLGISSRTVEAHRNKIRKKLGLHKKGGNLRAHLLSLL